MQFLKPAFSGMVFSFTTASLTITQVSPFQPYAQGLFHLSVEGVMTSYTVNALA
jgi:hypothetical protein